ncbi:hypothetical protein GOODEAATRI_015999, partial [Goodea atripinnis]
HDWKSHVKIKTSIRPQRFWSGVQQLHLHNMRQTENRAAVSLFTPSCIVPKQPWAQKYSQNPKSGGLPQQEIKT